MTNKLDTLNNVRSLRASARGYTLEELEAMLSKLTIVVDERRAEQEELAAKEAQQAEKLQEVMKKVEADGIDVETLIAALSGQAQPSKKTTRPPRPPKYKFMRNGKEVTWTGQGRTPSEIQKALDNGQTLEDFEIK